MTTKTKMIDVAIVYSGHYACDALKSGFEAKASTRVRFFDISVEVMLAVDAVSAIRSRNQAIREKCGTGFAAIVVAIESETTRQSISLSLRNNPGTASIIFPETLGVSPIHASADTALLTKLKEMESQLKQLKATQLAQGQVVKVLSSELDDVRDDSRVVRQDIYSRLNEGAVALREVTGGNLGTAKPTPTLLPQPEPTRFELLMKAKETVIGLVTLVGGGIFWAVSTFGPELVSPDLLNDTYKSVAPIEAPAEGKD